MKTALSFRTFAAIWGILLGPLVPVRGEELAATAPADTVAYVEWTDLGGPEAWPLRAARAVAESPLLRRQLDNNAAMLNAAIEGLGLMLAHPGFVAILVDPQAPGDDVEFGLVAATGPDTQRFSAALTRLLSKGGPTAAQEENVDGIGLQAWAMDAQTTFYSKTLDDRVILAGDGALAARLTKLAAGGGPALAASPEYMAARRKAGPGSPAGRLEAFVDLSRPLEALEADDESLTGIFTALQVKSWRSAFYRVEALNEGGRWYAFVHLKGDGGPLAALWRQTPLADSDLAVIPKDAYWASAAQLDLARLWNEGRDVISEVAPDAAPQVDGAIALSAQMLGFSITDDLLPALGDTWVLYDAPAHGGILFTGAVLINDARDGDALHGMLSRLVAFLKPIAAQKEVALQIRQMPDDADGVIHYVLVGGLPVPIAPAWSVADGRFVFGLFPQTVKTALRQVRSGTRRESLLDHPDFKAARAALPREITSVTYVDSRYYHRTVFGLMHLVNTALASLSAQNDAPFDLASYPTFPEDLDRVHNYVAGGGHDEDGIVYSGVGAPPLTMFAAGDGGFASVGTIALLVSILLPSLARARELAKRTVSMSNLKQIGVACHVYASDHGDEFPASLDVLLDAGLITADVLVSPRDPHPNAGAGAAPSSYTLIGGQDAGRDPRNVLAYETPISDEGTSVLFVDGHVEWMRPEPLTAALRATFQRLGRPEELPPELR